MNFFLNKLFLSLTLFGIVYTQTDDANNGCISPNHLTEIEMTGFEPASAMAGNPCGIAEGSNVCCSEEAFTNLQSWYDEAKDHYLEQDYWYQVLDGSAINYAQVWGLYGDAYAETATQYFEDVAALYSFHNIKQRYNSVNCNNAGRVISAGMGCGFCAKNNENISLQKFGTNYELNDSSCHELHEYCLPLYQQNMYTYLMLVNYTDTFSKDLYKKGMSQEAAENVRDLIYIYLAYAFDGKMCENYEDCSSEICLDSLGSMVVHIPAPVYIDLTNEFFFGGVEWLLGKKRSDVENDILDVAEKESKPFHRPANNKDRFELSTKQKKRDGHEGMYRAANYVVPFFTDNGFDVLKYGGFPETNPIENGFADTAFTCNSQPLEITQVAELNNGRVSWSWNFVQSEDPLSTVVKGFKIYYRFVDWSLTLDWRLLQSTAQFESSLSAKVLAPYRGRWIMFKIEPVQDGSCYAPNNLYTVYYIPEQ